MLKHRVKHKKSSLPEFHNVGSLPFNYLVVPILKGKPMASYFQPVVDKVKIKLALWKASMLSFAGKVQLIKSVI
jgi:hypothetical protein